VTETVSGSPHKAIIWVMAEVHDVNEFGECTGRVVHQIQQHVVATIDAPTRDETVKRLNESLSGLKTACQNLSTSP
jgi:hypothetical protein